MLDDFTVSGAGMGSFGLRAEFGGVDPAALRSEAQRIQALTNLDIASAELGMTNSGLVDKAYAMFAQQQGKSVDDLKNEWSGMVSALLPQMLGGDPSMRPVATAIASFVRDPKALAITAKGKSGPVKILSINTSDPVAALQAFTITAMANGVAAAPSAWAAFPWMRADRRPATSGRIPPSPNPACRRT